MHCARFLESIWIYLPTLEFSIKIFLRDDIWRKILSEGFREKPVILLY